MDMSRVESELAGFASITQNAIGEVAKKGFGIETTASTNQIVFWGLIVFAIFIGLRVRAVRKRGVHLTPSDKMRRFGLDRYRQI